MKFSIITPTFNRVETLKEAISSVKNQVHQNWELIIQDGCIDSPAKNDKEISELIDGDSRIIYTLEIDHGITDALNKAASKASGDIMVEMNDDDLLYDEWTLENINSLFKSLPPSTQWIYSKMQYIDENGTSGGEAGQSTSLQDLLNGNTICQPTVFWRKSLLDEVGGFDESFRLCQDYDLWIRFWKESEPIFYNQLIAKYRLHKGQLTNTMGQEQSSEAERVRQKYK